MKHNERMPIDFMGGHIEIAASGSFLNKQTNEMVNYDAKVDLSKIVDKNGKCTAKMFYTMLQSIVKSPDAMAALESLAKAE